MLALVPNKRYINTCATISSSYIIKKAKAFIVPCTVMANDQACYRMFKSNITLTQ